MKRFIRKILWKLGYDIHRKSCTAPRKKQLLELYGIQLILDVGANSGQFGLKMRNDLGFSGRIISFEPLSKSFKELKSVSKNDPKWEVIHCAIGDSNTTGKINITKNLVSSSLLKMLPKHIQAEPKSYTIGQETVEVKTLDSLMDDIRCFDDQVFLKIDTQGYESRVLRGAEKSLQRIHTLQIEMSFVQLYEGEMVFEEMHRFLIANGYCLVSIDEGFSDQKTGQLLQIDGLYHRF